MAITAYDRMVLNGSQLSQLQSATDMWNKASAANDIAGMNSAHTFANQIRGYATDDSGSALNMPSPNDFLHQTKSLVNESNAVAQANAQTQYDFNSAEAQKARDFSEYMSSTAHQREVRDLIAAGLNPVLSAGGQGASSGQTASASGSSAESNMSLNSVFGQYLMSLIQSATQINSANVSAQTQEKVAAMYNAMEYKIHNDFPQNAWQAFGPELESLINAAEGFFNKNSGSWVSKFDDMISGWKSLFDSNPGSSLFEKLLHLVKGDYAK